jgi:hypothetical protein
VPAGLGLVGTLITNAISWGKERDTVARRKRHLEEAASRVDFWKKWLEAIGPLCADDNLINQRVLAEKHLLQASDEIAAIYTKPTAEQQYHAFIEKRRGLPRWRRWLLLYRPLNGRAWTTRLVFFAYLVGLPLFINWVHSEHQLNYRGVHAHVMTLGHDQHAVEEVWQSYRAANQVVHIVEGILIVGVGLLALTFRSWSVHLEAQKNALTDFSPSDRT